MAELTHDLSSKTLAMVIGPAAIGKSTIMQSACELDHRFAYVTSFTTRPDRKDGKSTYQHLSEQEVSNLETNGDIVTSLRHPTTGYLYGTTLQSYPAEFNMLDTLSVSVDMYRTLPFKRTVAISLTANADDWESWILGRYPDASEERTKRLNEAILSIEWSLDQTVNHYWLINQPYDAATTAQQLLAIIEGNRPSTEAPPEARKLLQRAKLLLSYD